MLRMTKEEFLESGLLEQHVLGLLSVGEATDVGDFIAKHPSLQQIYDDHQRAILQMAKEHSITPPTGARDAIIRRLHAEKRPSNASGDGNRVRTAAIGAAIVLGALTLYNANEARQTSYRLEAKSAAYTQLESDCAQKNKEYESISKTLAFYQNPDTKTTTLIGNALAPDFKMRAHHNGALQQIKIDLLNPLSLPKDKILCLWGDVDGEMILISKIDFSAPKDQIIAFAPAMSSLNVTIEQDVDVIDHPDVSQLIASALTS